MEELQQEVERLRQENQILREQLAEALKKIEQLTALLTQNSQNSNWSSSKTKITTKKKPSKNTSQREKSNRKAGGQKGHKGATLKFSNTPDEVITHRPSSCAKCNHIFGEILEPSRINKRQVHDIPPIKIVVQEHQAETYCCPNCTHETSGIFPEHVSQPVQYGSRVKQLALYLRIEQFVPYKRSQQFFQDLFNLSISTGSLQNFMRKGEANVKPAIEKIWEGITNSDVGHADETGFEVEKLRYWLHTLSTQNFTYYGVHKSRGYKAMVEIGLLPKFKGKLGHDYWQSYYKFENVIHFLCNAHHLRDLQAVYEKDKARFKWARRMKRFLRHVWHKVKIAKEEGRDAFSPEELAKLITIYDGFVAEGLAMTPLPPPKKKGKRGRVAKGKARNLVERFRDRKAEILLFIHDFNVPFDNNLAERDIRMMKVQQKISGCFRSKAGAEMFCNLRSYTSTLRKQGISIWDGIGSLFAGDLILPRMPV